MRSCFMLALVAMAAAPGAAQVPAATPVTRAYKGTGRDSLSLHIFTPDIAGARRPAVLLFHGGGWAAGEPQWTFGSAREYAALGMVAVSVQYRLSDRKTATPVDAVEDARDAFRWVRRHAREFGIDTTRVIGHGVSAGGHLAAMAAVSSDAAARPTALVLWSPAVAAADDGWFAGLLMNRARPAALSPDDLVRKGMPPTIVISGVEDVVTPDSGARRYCARVRNAGGRCDVQSYPKVGHLLTRKLAPNAQFAGDFDWDPEATADARSKVRAFLRSLAYVRS